MVGTEIFDGSFEDLKKFCPKRFTRRTIVSKFWAVFDIFGLSTPLTASIKIDGSRAIKETDGWDAEVPVDVHDSSNKNFVDTEFFVSNSEPSFISNTPAKLIAPDCSPATLLHLFSKRVAHSCKT